MPPSGHGPGAGGPGMGGGMGFGPFAGAAPINSTMATANQMYDFWKTAGPRRYVGASTGYVFDNHDGFSFIDWFHKIGLAWDLSKYSVAGRLSSFIGAYHFIGQQPAVYARYKKVTDELDKQFRAGKIEPQEYGRKIMHEAMKYFGFLRDKKMMNEEEYRICIQLFAEEHGIEFSFGGPSR